MISRSNPMIAVLAWLPLVASTVPACAESGAAFRSVKQPVAAQSVTMQTAVRKSNDSGVTIQYGAVGVAQVGQAVSVVLQFDGVVDPAGAKVRFTADAGLTLTTASTIALPAGQRTTVTATVVSDRDGLAYLNVFVTQNGAMSIAAIPIRTGSTAPAKKGADELKSSAEGEKIIPMPAKEPK